MRTITKKLHSNRGASLLLALLFMLVCLVTGAVILTAATSASGSGRGAEREHRCYLAVSSAARLITGEITGMEFAVTDSGDPAAPTSSLDRSTLPVSAALLEVYKNGGSSVSDLDFKTTKDLPTVRGTLTVNANYSITVVLWAEDGGETLHTITLIFPSRTAGGGDTLTVTWDGPTTRKGGTA